MTTPCKLEVKSLEATTTNTEKDGKKQKNKIGSIFSTNHEIWKENNKAFRIDQTVNNKH